MKRIYPHEDGLEEPLSLRVSSRRSASSRGSFRRAALQGAMGSGRTVSPPSSTGLVYREAVRCWPEGAPLRRLAASGLGVRPRLEREDCDHNRGQDQHVKSPACRDRIGQRLLGCFRHLRAELAHLFRRLAERVADFPFEFKECQDEKSERRGIQVFRIGMRNERSDEWG